MRCPHTLDKHLSELTTIVPICTKAYVVKAVFLLGLTLLAVALYFLAQKSTLLQILSVFGGLISLPGLINCSVMLLRPDRFALRIDGSGIHETLMAGSRSYLWGNINSIGVEKTLVSKAIAINCVSYKRNGGIVAGQHIAHLLHNYGVDYDELLLRLENVKMQVDANPA